MVKFIDYPVLYNDGELEICLSATSFPTPAEDVLSTYQLMFRWNGQKEMVLDTSSVLQKQNGLVVSENTVSLRQELSPNASYARPTLKETLTNTCMKIISYVRNVGRRT
jgi:hypothetical protein